jgi:methionine transaminase
LADFSAVAKTSDEDFVLDLLRRKRVGTMRLSHFYSDGIDTGMIRLSFCKDDDVLREGGRLLSTLGQDSTQTSTQLSPL